MCGMYRWEYIWVFCTSEGAGRATTRKTLDHPALPRSVASLEHDHDLEALILDPFLKLAELGLEAAEVLPVLLSLHPLWLDDLLGGMSHGVL
jgi:hypothetical protein